MWLLYKTLDLVSFTPCFSTLLQKLCAIPEAANSEEVREFLALNTDARTAFQKKPSSSRIDKVSLKRFPTVLFEYKVVTKCLAKTEDFLLVCICDIFAILTDDGKHSGHFEDGISTLGAPEPNRRRRPTEKVSILETKLTWIAAHLKSIDFKINFRPRLRFSSKIAPALNVPDLRPKVTYSFSERCSVSIK